MARRSLATSVVITVSLGELALVGCKKPLTNPPISENPPPPMDDGAMDDDGIDDAAMDDGLDGPDDAGEDGAEGGDEGGDEAGDGETTTAQSHIQRRDDGTCIEIIDVDCPKGAMCNPPPPQEVPCPDNPAGGV